MKNIIFFIILGLLILVGATSYFIVIKNLNSESANWKTYHSEVDKISFRFPDGFREAVSVGEQGTNGSRAYFTTYEELDYLVSGLPPDGEAHIGYISLPYNEKEFNEYITSRTYTSPGDPEERFTKTETTLAGLPAVRIAQNSFTFHNPKRMEMEISYFAHDENKMYQFFIEYYKGDPNGAKFELDFETMIKTVTKI